MKSTRIIIALCLLFILPTLAFAQSENVDMKVLDQIRKEGMDNSKVMDIAFHLTEVSGPRLTGSPGFMRAANYAKDQLTQWGLSNAMLDPWGEFGKGWWLEKSYLAMTKPWYKPLIAFPKSWTSGTGGQKSVQVVVINAKDSAELEGYRGKLAGKIVMLDRTDVYNRSFTPDAERYTDKQLDSMANAIPLARQPRDTSRRGRPNATNQGFFQRRRMTTLLRNMATSEGAVAILSSSTANHDGTVYVQGGGAYKATDPANLLDLSVAFDDYMMIERLVKSGTPVNIDIDVQTQMTKDNQQGYNVIAEIPGSDNKLKDEVVMLGGHLDSWQGSTGATDNGAGSAVMMEAVRILKALNLKPARTIRIALWSGEEQGLFGSSAYVKKTFADPSTMQLLPAHEKLSAYYNLDNGSGRIRGIYAENNEAVSHIFKQWFAPFSDLGANTLTLTETDGTDHMSFDAVGLPAFQFIQDPIDYETRTHHSNMDSYDHLVEADLKQAAVIVASFVYNTAMRADRMPRKELPKPRPARRGM